MDSDIKYAEKRRGKFVPFYTFKDNPKVYRQIHYWLWRYIIQAYRCGCGSVANMNMSLIPGKPYDFDVNNFEPKCNSCNQKQDWTIEKKISHKARTKKTFESPEYRLAQSKRITAAWKEGKYADRDETNMVWNNRIN